MHSREGPWALKGEWDLDRSGQERAVLVWAQHGQSLRLEWTGSLIGMVEEVSLRVRLGPE